MVAISSQVNTVANLIVLYLGVGLISPFVEEVIFRGIAYSKIRATSLGTVGAILIPSFIFTMMYYQYNQIEIYVLIFISSCLLGLMRHIFNSLWCCIVAHMTMNVMAVFFTISAS